MERCRISVTNPEETYERLYNFGSSLLGCFEKKNIHTFVAYSASSSDLNSTKPYLNKCERERGLEEAKQTKDRRNIRDYKNSRVACAYTQVNYLKRNSQGSRMRE